MIRLPPFRYVAVKSAQEAAAVLAGEGPQAMLLAGGTDLLPNMKRRQQLPKTLIGLRGVAGFRDRATRSGTSVIGAGATLEDLARDRALAAQHAALWRAAAQVATPLIRNQATLGGNLCLDTRCNYYNQSAEWRKAIDFCMKAPRATGGEYRAGDFVGGGEEPSRDGDEAGSICWVAPGSPRCWAVSSSDTAPALLVLAAEVQLVGRGHERRLPIDELYHGDGMAYLTKKPDEVLTSIVVPEVAGRVSTYWKLRRRGSFDFPVAAVAIALDLGAGGVVVGARIALGAVASRPLLCAEAAASLVGRPLTSDGIAACADLVSHLAKPLDNTDYRLGWRKSVVKSLAVGALRELRGDAPDTLGTLARHARRTLPMLLSPA